MGGEKKQGEDYPGSDEAGEDGDEVDGGVPREVVGLDERGELGGRVHVGDRLDGRGALNDRTQGYRRSRRRRRCG